MIELLQSLIRLGCVLIPALFWLMSHKSYSAKRKRIIIIVFMILATLFSISVLTHPSRDISLLGSVSIVAYWLLAIGGSYIFWSSK